jgi:serine/threonine-protein kinase HipA
MVNKHLNDFCNDLSPAYDINPNESGAGLSLNISKNDNSLVYHLCLSITEYFRWELKNAKTYIANVSKEISSWSRIANEFKISNREQSFIEQAFNI